MPALILPFKGVLPRIHESAFIADTAVIIGDVEIGPDSSIWYGCVVRGDVNEIRIGARTNIQDGTIIHVASAGQGTYIGDDITVGHMAVLHACTVESGAFIGMKACVMDDCHVESEAMVGAGALLSPKKRVKRHELWTGTPAKHARALREAELAYFPHSAAHYVELAKAHKS